MIRDITLGQYYPGNSWVHKLDPRVKIIATLLFLIEQMCIRDSDQPDHPDRDRRGTEIRDS